MTDTQPTPLPGITPSKPNTALKLAIVAALKEYGDPIKNAELPLICPEAVGVEPRDLSHLIYQIARDEPERGIVRVRHGWYQWVPATQRNIIPTKPAKPRPTKPAKPEQAQVLHDAGDHLLVLYKGKAWKAVELS